jgi:mannose-1-phosphate guanylyltransferase
MYALILAGGQGERLRPLTDNLPKPMVPVGGKPILERQIEWLKAIDVTDVVFLAGYRWEAIKDHFGDGGKFGIRAFYSVEDSPLGRGGAIRKGFSQVPENSGPVAVLNGDIVTFEDPRALLKSHHAKIAANPAHLATLLVVPMVSPYGLVEMNQSGDVIAFREKVEMPHWINGGVYILEPDITAELPELGDHETSTFPELAQSGRISAYESRAFWRSVDSFKDLREAEEGLNNRA